MKIANTLRGILEDPTMEKIMDRESNTDDVVAEVLGDWQYDLFSRNPAPAYAETGEFKGTDLDVATLMSALADRNAVVNIPTYTSRREKTHNSNEWIVSSNNRHGNITGLNANKDAFSFSVKIYDQNVVNRETGKTGAHRNFLLTDIDGDMYNGWNKIEFDPSAKENDFLKNKDVYSGSSIVVKNFVHPNAWVSVYGAPYMKAKALENRLGEEGKYFRDIASGLKAMGIRKADDGIGSAPRHVYREPGKSVQVETLTAELDMPELTGKFDAVPANAEGMMYAKSRANALTYSILPKVRFATRAAELAFYKNGNDGNHKPGWEVPSWESGHKVTPRSRTEWNKMDMDNGVALRYRVHSKAQRVR